VKISHTLFKEYIIKIEDSLGYHKKTQLTDSRYILADYAIIRRYNRLSITNKFEIKLLRVRRGGRWLEKGGKVNR
jgi:hypothetical protein